MTSEEAIKRLNWVREQIDEKPIHYTHQALDMAIEALGETNVEDTISRKAAIKALDDISRAYYDLGLSCAYDMPSFWYNEKKDYKVIPTKYHKGYQQALEDSEQRIKKIMEELCYG